MKKVCVKCQIELLPHENGVVAVSMASFGPYELYEADVWCCSECSWEGILGFAVQPFAVHHSSDLVAEINRLKESGRVIHYFWLNQNEKEEGVI